MIGSHTREAFSTGPCRPVASFLPEGPGSLRAFSGQTVHLRWRESVSCRNLWASAPEECRSTPRLPPSGKSLPFCDGLSWRSEEYSELGVPNHPLWGSCEMQIAFFRLMAPALFCLHHLLLLGSWIILKGRKYLWVKVAQTLGEDCL